MKYPTLNCLEDKAAILLPSILLCNDFERLFLALKASFFLRSPVVTSYTSKQRRANQNTALLRSSWLFTGIPAPDIASLCNLVSVKDYDTGSMSSRTKSSTMSCISSFNGKVKVVWTDGNGNGKILLFKVRVNPLGR